MMTRLGFVASVALTLTTSCAMRTPPVATPQPDAPSSATAALIDRVVQLRGLRPLRTIIVRELDDEQYADAWAKLHETALPAGSRAFLSRKDSVIYTRGANDAQLTELVVTALQNQHYSYGDRVDRLRAEDSDAADALAAFANGEANLVQLLASGPSPHELASHARQLSTLTLDAAIAAGRVPASVRNERPADVRVLMLQQVHSLAFVTRLYLAGGWPLVQRVWEHPPTQLATLADPEMYLAGTGHAAKLPVIPPIEGYNTIENTAVLNQPLAEALFLAIADLAGARTPDTASATRFAKAQRGISIAIVTRPSYGRAFVVVSAWSSPTTAAQFAEKWRSLPETTKDCGPIAKQREHAVVASLCLGDKTSTPLLDTLLAAVGALPAAEPPLGVVPLPALETY